MKPINADTLVYKEGMVSLAAHSYYFEDNSRTLSAQQVLEQNAFEFSGKQVLNFNVSNSNFWINDEFINLLTYSDYEGLDHQMWKDLHQWLGMGEYHFDFEMGHKLDTSTVLKRTPIKL